MFPHPPFRPHHRLKQPSPFSSSSFSSLPFQPAVTFSSFGFFSVVSGCTSASSCIAVLEHISSQVIILDFGLQNQQHRLPQLLWFSPSSATLLNFFFSRSVVDAVVIGELKAVVVRSFSGKGEGVLDALLIRGSSPLPCQTITTQSPSFWLSSSHRGPPYFILFGSHLQVSTCRCFNLQINFYISVLA